MCIWKIEGESTKSPHSSLNSVQKWEDRKCPPHNLWMAQLITNNNGGHKWTSIAPYSQKKRCFYVNDLNNSTEKC